jgi:glycosyltransferase involved in cell wall biosynthesis
MNRYSVIRKNLNKTSQRNNKIKIKPQVSIIIPVYNNHEHIIGAIESVMNQTYKKWELIIVNDASTDTTNKLITEFLKKLKNVTRKKIKYLKNKKNRGCYISIQQVNILQY